MAGNMFVVKLCHFHTGSGIHQTINYLLFRKLTLVSFWGFCGNFTLILMCGRWFQVLITITRYCRVSYKQIRKMPDNLNSPVQRYLFVDSLICSNYRLGNVWDSGGN
jgi:hypothetical protein